MKLQVTMMYKYWRSYQVAYSVRAGAEKPEFFDYTTNANLDDYKKNFVDQQQILNTIFGRSEGFQEITGDTLTFS
jgi:hypothetical protein